jgi:hypothetical protein
MAQAGSIDGSAIPTSLFYKAGIRKSGGVDIPIQNQGRIWTQEEIPKVNGRKDLILCHDILSSIRHRKCSGENLVLSERTF